MTDAKDLLTERGIDANQYEEIDLATVEDDPEPNYEKLGREWYRRMHSVSNDLTQATPAEIGVAVSRVVDLGEVDEVYQPGVVRTDKDLASHATQACSDYLLPLLRAAYVFGRQHRRHLSQCGVPHALKKYLLIKGRAFRLIQH